MLTKEDLSAIREVIQAEGNAIRQDMATKSDLLAEREHTRKTIHEELDLNNAILATFFKVDLADLATAMKAGFQEVVKAIKETKHTQKTQQDETAQLKKQVEELRERLERLEKQAGLSR
jgi:septal ring factor EnvC (AmiA/AmiB activator)